eukprot:g18464.t1
MAHGPGLKRELGLLWAERQKQRPPKEPSECYSCGSKEHLARDCPLSEIRLTFSAGDAKVAWEKQVDVERGTTAVLTGGLVRGLRPDEASVAMRLRAALSVTWQVRSRFGDIEQTCSLF